MAPMMQHQSVTQTEYAPAHQPSILDAVIAEQEFKASNPLLYQMLTRSRLDELHARLGGRKRKNLRVIQHPPCDLCNGEFCGNYGRTETIEEDLTLSGPVGTLPD